MDCSIIIVNYNTRDLLIGCLTSIYKAVLPERRFEVIVVDNASKDGSRDAVNILYPEVKLLHQESNLGFAKANNKGISVANGRYILLLNSDTVVQPDTLEKMLDLMDSNSYIGASGCKVVLPDGTLDKACKRSIPTPVSAFYHYLGISKLFPNNRKFGAYNLTYVHEDEISEVGAIVGAFMLVRKKVIDEIGVLSEDYFMYAEDIDWCYRIKKAGWKIVYYPKAQITHYKRASSKKAKLATTFHFYKSMIIFYNKFHRSRTNWLLTLLTYCGVGVIFLLSISKGIIDNFIVWILNNIKGKSKGY